MTGERAATGNPLRITALMEAATVTGPAKNLIRFARENRRRASFRILTFVRGSLAAARYATNPFIDAARNAGLEVVVIPEKRRFDLSVLGHLKQAFADGEPDVVQSHSVKSHFLLSLAGKACPRPWIAFHHGYTNENFKMRVYNALDRYSLRRCDHVVTVCEAFLPHLARCGVPRGKVDILHNSIDPGWGPDAGEVAALRASLGLAPDVVRVLAAGRLSAEKGHAMLMEAAAEVKRLRPDLAFEILLAGDGPLRETLSNLARARGIDTAIRFAGQVANVRAYFGVADVMALPSLSEGSPNVLLEAMAARVAVVATRVGGVPEIVRHRESALLVPAGDVCAMAAALEELISNAGLRKELAATAQQRVRSEFSPARYDERLMGVYEQVLAKSERN